MKQTIDAWIVWRMPIVMTAIPAQTMLAMMEPAIMTTIRTHAMMEMPALKMILAR
jgi:hypothetical protein